MIKLELNLDLDSINTKLKELKSLSTLSTKDVNELNRLENIKYRLLKKVEDKKMNKFEQVINKYANNNLNNK